MKFDNYKSEVGIRIMKARLERDMTQHQLAKAIGRTQPSITQIESGKVLPGTAILFELGKVLDKPVNHFFPDTVPNRMFGSSVVGLVWMRIRYWWYRRTRNKTGQSPS
ncbi:helix-turn-helix transcriptional regulator [Parapedobacter sp. 10938]|uniref:helix-turn-helix transcriptional regulator n=1 Tax=Parapedobacter flavus TaxID=3110225 RepID=UPI002DBBF046|nr:helix-turn-helix transcriptional regulator [Parapedobacter sp. 10938]MEC3881605.1 helix-turn-helix transcriptional regulator [Parapedobacter sp. 10938]